MPNKELLLTYANNKIKISALEAENEMLKNQVLLEVQASMPEGMDQLALEELPGYSFTIVPLKAWTFSSFIKESEKALKERKEEEKQNGEATFIESVYVKFNPPKE